MTRAFNGLFILLFFLGSLASAKMRLVEWHIENVIAPFILSVRDSESPQNASERYLKNLAKSPGLSELFNFGIPELKTTRFVELIPKDADHRILLQANSPADYTKNSVRVEKFNSYFEKWNQENFLLPINPTLGLTFYEQREVFDLIYENFAVYVGLGGDDVDPWFAHQENFHARNFVSERDQAEIKLIQHFIRRGQSETNPLKKSFYFGTCRGSQIASVALGYQLIQDIPFEVDTKLDHSEDWHTIRFLPTTHEILKQSSRNSNFKVNSLHHQAVIYKKGGFLELAALSSDGIVEATEFKNGRGLLIQFHAELMDNQLGEEILSQVVKAKDRTGAFTCNKLF